jgi:hypothetical protein
MGRPRNSKDVEKRAPRKRTLSAAEIHDMARKLERMSAAMSALSKRVSETELESLTFDGANKFNVGAVAITKFIGEASKALSLVEL